MTTQPEQLVEASFWERVEKTDGCWIWRGSLSNGYGTFSYRGKPYRAHRFAYEVSVGPIPEGLVLDHLCRNPPCVNPAHLEPVTNAENILRGISPTAQNARKTHCPQGHEYTPENVREGGRGRDCLICHREWSRRYMLRRRRLAREAQRGVPLAVKESM